jgi:DNA-binding CsgD family transcriptional regulator
MTTIVPIRRPERRVLIKLGEGKDYDTIATELGLKRSTVKRLFTSIQKKTKMNLVQLALHISKQQEEAC